MYTPRNIAPPEPRRQMIRWAVRGDPDAAELVEQVNFCVEIWDDLIDGDRTVTADEINYAFWLLFVEIPKNRFYRQFFEELQPLMKTWISNWFDANEFEAEGADNGLNIAYGLRNSIGEIVIQCAYLIGGYEWMRQVSREIRKMIFREDLEAYKQEFQSGREDSGGQSCLSG